MPLPDVAGVVAMAPDAASAKAGQGLASVRQWTGFGLDEDALWGLCQGSGKSPYQVRVALATLTTACTCPSRKFPCKHSLGLMLLAAQGLVPAGEQPAFVSEWLGERKARAEKKERAIAAEQTPEAQAKAAAQAEKRAENRGARMGAGIEELRRWLADLVRAGLGNAPTSDESFWATRAKRLVDAQLPGLANRIARCHGHVATRADWPVAVLRELGLVALALEAHARQEALAPDELLDLARVLGTPQEKEGAEERVDDEWLCLGTRGDVTGALNVQRAWFTGAASGRYAHVVAVAPAHMPLAPVGVPGRCERLALRFFPSAFPVRAFIDERLGEAPQRPCADRAVASALEAQAHALAADPWQDGWPLEVAGRFARDATGAFWIRDDAGDALPLSPRERDAWLWLAVTGGERARFALEWNGEHATILHGWRA